MKNKIVFSLLLSIVLGGFNIGSAYAESEISNQSSISIKEEQEIVEYLRNIPENQSTSDAVDEYLKNNPVTVQELLDETSSPESKGTKNEPIDFNEYIQENLDSKTFRSYEVDEDTELIFTDGSTFFISEYEEELVSENSLPLKDQYSVGIRNFSTLATTSTKTKRLSNTYTAKNLVGMTLWEAYTSGWFTYNGTKVTKATHDYSYIKRGALSAWKTTNYSNGSRLLDSKTGEIYVTANVSWGIGYGGVDFNFQDKYFKLYIRSNEKGKISRDYIMR